jgi:hypothetical protein
VLAIFLAILGLVGTVGAALVLVALGKALGFFGGSVIVADFVLGGLAVCFKVLAEVVAADAGAGLAALLEVVGVVAGLVCATTKSTFNMPNKQPLAKMEQKKPKR